MNLIALLIAAGWPTAGHDARRTGQSEVSGPIDTRYTASAGLDGQVAVNMPPIAVDDRIIVGTWGITHNDGGEDRSQWDKSDGHLFGFDRHLSSVWAHSGDLVPWCYSYDGRADAQCPDGGYWNRYNGTFEGTPAWREGVIYAGRGDGKLYAIDAETGESVWTFTTFNPEDPADPEGGGEILTGPLVDGDGVIYFGTAAVGLYETNAIYALNPDGSLRWRYPSETRGLDAFLWASFALSPDGATLYAATAWGPTVDEADGTTQGRVFAFDVAEPTGTGEDRLRWSYTPINTDLWWQPTVWTRALAVGADGTLYAGGMEATFGGGTAVVFALRDGGDEATLAWPAFADVDFDRAQYVTGLALREVEGQTVAVVATSGDRYTPGGFREGGLLQVMDPADGSIQWSFNPEDHGGTGALSGVAIDAEGRLYTASGGTTDTGGKVFALSPEGAVLWSLGTDGMMAWSHPILGPRGELSFADFEECPLFAFPVEWGWCEGYDISPSVYVVYAQDPDLPDDTGVGDDTAIDDSGSDSVASDDSATDDSDSWGDSGAAEKPPGCGCGFGSFMPHSWVALLGLLLLRRR